MWEFYDAVLIRHAIIHIKSVDGGMTYNGL
jgi:hypothetical protein